MKRLAATLLIVLGVSLCATAPASARPYGWYGYRPYYAYRPYYGAYYSPRAYWGGYRAYYPGPRIGIGFSYGYPGYGAYYGGYPYAYGYPGYAYPGSYGYYGW